MRDASQGDSARNYQLNGAGNEARTRDPQLGRLMLYQLSYSRVARWHLARRAPWWREEDSNLRRRKPAGLQPAPFGHSGIPPHMMGYTNDIEL